VSRRRGVPDGRSARGVGCCVGLVCESFRVLLCPAPATPSTVLVSMLTSYTPVRG
jgi:hypothetical protein